MRPHFREHWGSRIGLILAMAGNAVGLGNFLRFPVQVMQHGGGAFMIPYLISFLVLGLPMMWVEWGVGRYGGSFGYGTVPRMFDRLWRHPAAKYVGTLGLVLPLIILVYYTVIVGWLLGFAYFSLTGGYFGLDEAGVRAYLSSFQDIRDSSHHGGLVGFGFYAATLAIVVWVVSRGISGGIEKLALFGLPLLFLFALVLMIRVLTLPATALGSPGEGLAYMWRPQWSALLDAKVWLAAAGQIFFTLSVGSGIMQTYASYLSRDQDLVGSGLATASTNEAVELAFGGTIAIPAAVTFFGLSGAAAIAAGGTFDLGIVAMAVVLQRIPGGPVVAHIASFMWFFLLFVAGLTTSVALASPGVAFLREEFGLSRRRAAVAVGMLALPLGLATVWWYKAGFLTEWDYWGGTFCVALFACAEIWVIRLAFGLDAFWEEIHRGAAFRIPGVFRLVLRWITPAFLTGLLLWWGWTDGLPLLAMEGVPREDVVPRWIARGSVLGLLAAGWLAVRRAWRNNPGADQAAI